MSCSDFNERFTLWIERSLLSKNYVPIKKSPHMGESVKMAHFASGRFHHFQWCLLDYRNRAKIFIIEQKFQGLKHRLCIVLDIFSHKMRHFPLGQIRLYTVLDIFSHMGRFFYGDVGPHTFLLNYCALIRSLKSKKIRFSIISLRDRHGLSWDFGRLPISRNWTTFAMIIFKVY